MPIFNIVLLSGFYCSRLNLWGNFRIFRHRVFTEFDFLSAPFITQRHILIAILSSPYTVTYRDIYFCKTRLLQYPTLNCFHKLRMRSGSHIFYGLVLAISYVFIVFLFSRLAMWSKFLLFLERWLLILSLVSCFALEALLL